jgi:hypothetical protein
VSIGVADLRFCSMTGRNVGSGHDEAEVEALKAAARQRLMDGQGAFALGLDSTESTGGPLEIAGRAELPFEARGVVGLSVPLDRDLHPARPDREAG